MKRVFFFLFTLIIAFVFSGCDMFAEDTNILTYYTATPVPSATQQADGEEDIDYDALRLYVDVPVNSFNALLNENIPEDTTQVILVTVTEDGEQLYCVEKMENGWKIVYGPFECNIGRNGIGKEEEGDGKSPSGIYELGSAFGFGDAPDGCIWPWRETITNDYWVDDPDSEYYNQYVNTSETEKDWTSAESLNISKYRLALEVEYNSENEPGLGSAIFLHVWGSETEDTGGCTAMEESTMETILTWLRPTDNPLLYQTEYISQVPEGFCYIKDYTPEIVFDIKFAGSENFMGRQALEYYTPVAIASVEMAKILDKASILLEEQGLSLLVYDCYRPQTTVNNIVDWVADEDDLDAKETYYPNTEKSEMTNMYFLADSYYSRGAAVDVSIVDENGKELDMGTIYQYIDESSSFDYTDLTDEQYNNRELLRDIMIQAGLTPNDEFWWSFYIEDEPFPEETFDFYVQ